MRAVGGTEAVIAEETVRRDEIDVFVGLHPGSDLDLTGLLLGGLVSIRLLVEITSLPADCLKEDQRSLGMSLTDDVHKAVERFVDHLRGRIRELVEHKGISVNVRGHSCPVFLKLGLTAEPKIQAVQPVVTAVSRHVAHPGPACRRTVGYAGSQEDNLVGERIRRRGDGTAGIHTDLKRLNRIKKEAGTADIPCFLPGIEEMTFLS